jgi:heterodisulfide reductase subunit C
MSSKRSLTHDLVVFLGMTRKENCPVENASNPLLRPQVSLPGRLANAHLTVNVCFQCRKCSAGCPLAFAMDLFPDQIIRLALLGQEDEVLSSRTIWVCSACETCTTRCPNGIDIAGVMDWLKGEAVRLGNAIAEENVASFHRFFLESLLAAGGRLPEARLMRRYTLYNLKRQPDLGKIKENLSLGWKLWKRRRVRLVGPPALRGRGEIKELFRKAGF